VGAGAAGSYAAYELASLGHHVAVFEEKSAPGLNVCCTGIISTECFDSFGISTDVILTKANSAKFFSPSGRCLRLQTEKVQAYVVDRLLLDKAIASKAQTQGAHYFFSQVIDIIPGKDSIQAETLCFGAREIFTARAVILANGFRPKLPQKLGLGKIKSFLIGAQAEVEAKKVDELEVYFGQKIAPGSFAWLVPTSANKAYVGLLSTSQAKLHLQKFLLSPFCQGRIMSQEVEIRQKAIPIGTLGRSYGDRVLVIGDAAGQVKPTTGGGIYFGHLGAQIAAKVLDEALSSDNLTAGRLSRYQKQWKAKMGKELSRGYWARWAYAKLSDRQIEGIFNMLDSGGMAEALLKSNNFSFDWHSRLILASLRHSSVYPRLRIRHLLSREAS
jgi:geranylgeranyl reductase family protein